MLPKVSVVCITYNHAAFLEDALESFVNQETDFPFEVIVHDDCSTDGTTDILRKYAEKYPDIIVPVYEEENCYSRGVKIVQPLFVNYANGKYIAVCEGDDYWCDNKKLQKQFDYMEANPECSLMMHNGYILDVISGRKKLLNPYPDTGKVSAREVIVEGKTMPPTASMFFKRSDIIEMPEFFLNAGIGDRTRRMYLLNRGYVYYMIEPMCVYRINVSSSFGQLMKSDPVKRKAILDKMIKFLDGYEDYSNGKFHDEVDFVKSREYFLYHLRCGNRKKAYSTRYYMETFSKKEKLMYIISSFVPEKLKNIIKKIKRKG